MVLHTKPICFIKRPIRRRLTVSPNSRKSRCVSHTTKANSVIRNANYEKVVLDYYHQGDTAYEIAKTLMGFGLPTPNGSQAL